MATLSWEVSRIAEGEANRSGGTNLSEQRVRDRLHASIEARVAGSPPSSLLARESPLPDLPSSCAGACC